MLASDAVILGSSIFVVSSVGRGWTWPYLIWGVLLAPLWFLAMRWIQGRSTLGLPDSAWIRSDGSAVDPEVFITERRAADLRDRWIVYVGMATFCLCAGIYSAGLRSAIPDIIVTIMIVVIGLVAPLVMLGVLRRRIVAGRLRLPLPSPNPSGDDLT